MNGTLHYGETRRWAVEAGFSETDADAVARADIGVDRLHPGRLPKNWAWHYACAGANKRARELFRQAVEDADLVRLGEALHCRQDALTHGVLGPLGHWPGIDDWVTRSARVRGAIERATRDMLGDYLMAFADADERG